MRADDCDLVDKLVENPQEVSRHATNSSELENVPKRAAQLLANAHPTKAAAAPAEQTAPGKKSELSHISWHGNSTV
ncbi:hypothetical protein MAR_012418 [Mya arenaria]|uniref:Uncharacterized protein n=1 Tax=Mya arenaria TaxID=6604 RepID=A0ABY7FZL1_MYAAR|nr:hypothetical protein MAR_012418 [Mya arenaria]